ncbi:MAG: hypothetical protein Q4P36_09430 [Bowdeniella nasicola]|nr:hypothetical protein [Bowdeniella nasicola]
MSEKDVDRIFAEMMRSAGLDSDSTAEADTDHVEDPRPASDVESEDGSAVAEARSGEKRALAVILTPIADAQALAGLCAMSGIDVKVIPTSTGAVAALEFTPEPTFTFESLTTGVHVPQQANDVAALLSKTSKLGAVLVVVEIREDDGEWAGHMIARDYANGAAGEELSPGLVLAGVDPIIEDLLLGVQRLDEVEVHDSATMSRLKAARAFMRGIKRPKGR